MAALVQASERWGTGILLHRAKKGDWMGAFLVAMNRIPDGSRASSTSGVHDGVGSGGTALPLQCLKMGETFLVPCLRTCRSPVHHCCIVGNA